MTCPGFADLLREAPELKGTGLFQVLAGSLGAAALAGHVVAALALLALQKRRPRALSAAALFP